MGLQFPLFLNERNADSLFIAEDDGRIIAHNGIMLGKIMINGHDVTMASMGAVCTDPDYRGQGIATRVLHEALAWLRDKGVGLLTISGDRGLYTRNGAVHTSGAKRFTLAGRSTDPEGIEALAASMDLLSLTYYGGLISMIADEMADLYQTEPVRYERSRREFPILLKAAPPISDVPYPPDLEALTSWIGPCLTAYVLGYKKDGQFRVIEYAGDRLAVCLLLRQALANAMADSVVVKVPLHDVRLISQLESIGYTAEREPYAATFLAPNPKMLWQQVRPILRERVLEAGHGQVPDEPPVAQDNDQELIDFLFGAVDRQVYGQPWDTALPLPLPWMEGLNYI